MARVLIEDESHIIDEAFCVNPTRWEHLFIAKSEIVRHVLFCVGIVSRQIMCICLYGFVMLDFAAYFCSECDFLHSITCKYWLIHFVI